jgi:type I restriction enzyme S subunit
MISVFDSPSHWSSVPIWSMYSRVKRTGYPDQELLSVYRDYGVIPKSSRDDNHNVASEDLSTYQLVEVGDLVVNKMKAWQGSFAVSSFEGIVSPAYFVYKPHHQSNNRFLHYMLRSAPYMAHYNRISSGVRIGQWDLDPAQFRLTEVPLPPLAEQKAIADFLDRELAQIDALIAKQTEVIHSLEERQVVVIRESVLRGLEKSTRLSESGTSWVGAYPSHWQLLKLKHFAQLESGRDYKEIEVTEGGYPVLGSGGEFARASSYLFCGESVLFGRKGTIDKPLYVNECFWTVDTMYYTRLRESVIPKFVYYWATTLPYKAFSTNTALPSMTSSDIREFKMPTPPIEEQRNIVNFLDSETVALDQLINKSKSLIKTSQERRQSLISAAVTGKIDVRKVA